MSAPCRDLLSRLLVANANQRMSMEEMKEHSWFLEDLPEGALVMNDWYLRPRPVYDQACCPLPHAVLPALSCWGGYLPLPLCCDASRVLCHEPHYRAHLCILLSASQQAMTPCVRDSQRSRMRHGLLKASLHLLKCVCWRCHSTRAWWKQWWRLRSC